MEVTDNSRERLIWEYSFLLTRLNHSIPNPDTHETTQHLNTIYHLRSLATQNTDFELVELSCLLEIHYALVHNLTNVDIDSLLSLAIDASTRNPLREQNIYLSLLRMLLHVLHLVRLGKSVAALGKLREHHQLMDFVISKESFSHDGRFDLLIGHGQKLTFYWLGQSEGFVVGYLLSGMVNLPDSTSYKGISFLNEGVKVLDGMHITMMLTQGLLSGEKIGIGPIWLSEMIQQQERWMKMKRYTLLYLSFAHLLRSNWAKATGTIDMLRAISSPDDVVFSHLFALLLGTQAQYHGDLSKARTHYSQIPPTAGEIYLLSLLNQALLFHNPDNPADIATSNKLLEEVEQRLTRDGPVILPQIKTAYTLVKGLVSREILKSRYIRL